MDANQLDIKLRILHAEEVAMGPGKADLLVAIEECGSISGAARAMGMSYRRAWLLVDTMNRCFREPLVATAAGGSKGGGAYITEAGRAVLTHYRRMQRKSETAAQAEWKKILSMLEKR
ncbi:MAG: LysR family transcriptional regulator [Paucimonas sp.]|jgi:molybdate transport system regulatory protein|nr:LysR family transcriptional regulator [Paucimonas sp.]